MQRKNTAFGKAQDVIDITFQHTYGLFLMFKLILQNLKVYYSKCSKISNTLKLRTPKIIAENNF